MPAPVVEVLGLGRSFGTVMAVSGADLRLMPGETVALVGANGGGKTTLLRMLAGLVRPDGGEGRVLGMDVRRAGRRIAAHAGYMPQRLSLYPDLSVLENLRFRAALRGLPRPADAARDMAARFGLSPVLARPAGVLSDGWARRAQLAATLFGQPALLLLDEPTAGLDPVARADVWSQIAALAQAGAAIAVSTHDAAEAEFCAQAMVLIDGRVAARGAPRAVIAAHPGCSTLADCIRALAAPGLGAMLRTAA